MPRPIRISYPNAFYHIMNRGRGRQAIFHNKKYFLTFLYILSEANQKFGCVVHAYCLMSNHYHLILETPNSDLSRIMRHVNGVYTQKYNRLKKTDGPLFRGRFKAILIDEKDSYLLQLNRYIHRNPISAKNKLVTNLEDYQWSSYPAFLNLCKTPKWLNKEKTLEMLESKNNLKKYQAYIDDNKDDLVQGIYDKKVLPMVFGGKEFKKKIRDKIADLTNVSISQDRIKSNLNDHVTAAKIIKAVSKTFDVKEPSIINYKSGRAKNNFPRKFAMYLCQLYARNSLSEIKSYFNLKSVGSVSNAIYSVKKELNCGRYMRELAVIKNDLLVI